MMTCINVEKDHSMIETRRLENVAIFVQTITCLVFTHLLDMQTRIKHG